MEENNSRGKAGLIRMKLGVLDQSPVIEGKSHAEALHDTVELAEEADRLGLSRFWVSEHHAAANFSRSKPRKCLFPHIASRTKHIKVGSGGICSLIIVHLRQPRISM